MSFFPGKDPQAGDSYSLRRHRACRGAAHGRSRRRLLGAARAAVGALAHGRAVHFFRSFRAGRIPRRQRARRAAASAYRARHRHLSVRRRDHAPRQPRHRGADQAGRSELDDRRARHRAFRAHRRPSCAPPAVRSTACRCGWRCRPPRRKSSRALRITRPPNFRWSRTMENSCAWWSARSTARRRRCRRCMKRCSPTSRYAPARACRSTPITRSARSMSSTAPSTSPATSSSPAGCWCSSRATR